jgi:hypothetical protein
MHVNNLHTWTLDEAIRDSGLVIASAGNGLPRRITGQIDYAARVLALDPSAYWQMNSATSAHADSVPGGQALNDIGGGTFVRQSTGHGRGGDIRTCLDLNSGRTLSGGVPAARHTFTVGQPFSLSMFHRRRHTGALLSSDILIGTKYQLSYIYSGWGFFPSGFALHPGNTSTLSISAAKPGDETSTYSTRWIGGVWNHFVVSYNGGPTNQTSSWAYYVNGESWTISINGGLFVNGTAFPGTNILGASGLPGDYQDIAIWNNRALTTQEVMDLASPPLGRSTFSHVIDGDSTVKSLILPGRHRRDLAGSACATSYISLDAGAYSPIEQNSTRLGLTVQSGSVVSIAVDLVHHAGTPLPYIGDDEGGGPAFITEEEAPPHPATITSIHSYAGRIEIQTDHGFDPLPPVISDPRPAVQISGATLNENLLTLEVQLQSIPGVSGSATYDPPPSPPQGVIA